MVTPVAVVCPLGATQMFGWCANCGGIARSSNGGFGGGKPDARLNDSSEPDSGIRCSDEGVPSLLVQKSRLECTQALLKGLVFELREAGRVPRVGRHRDKWVLIFVLI